MPLVIIKSLDCVVTESTYGADKCRLEISVDGQDPTKMRRRLNNGDKWILEMPLVFQNDVRINLWDEDWPDGDDHLVEVVIGTEFKHRAWGNFTLDDASYTLWYEVMDVTTNPVKYHRLPNSDHPEISFRQMLGRFGRGVMPKQFHQKLMTTAIYQCSEVISLRDTFQFHAMQDRGKGSTNSVKTWINRHCNLWGEETVIPIRDTPEGYSKAEIGVDGKSNWKAVESEQSRVVAGFQHYSRRVGSDLFISHETMDWLWDQVVDPAFTYMLDYTAKRKNIMDDRDGDLEKVIQFIHNEWETGSFPVQWRPFRGEYVTTWGRHVFDVGHAPVYVEMHPAHTLIREHTTAGPLGNGGTWVPVNRAIIDMGFSGGFPKYVGSRWKDEFGEKPDDIWGDTVHCWATNLKKHPLKFRLFPPVIMNPKNWTTS